MDCVYVSVAPMSNLYMFFYLTISANLEALQNTDSLQSRSKPQQKNQGRKEAWSSTRGPCDSTWALLPHTHPSLRAWIEDPGITATSFLGHPNQLNPTHKPVCFICMWIMDAEYYSRKITQPSSLILKMYANRAALNFNLPHLLAGFGPNPVDKHFLSPSVFSHNIISVVFF